MMFDKSKKISQETYVTAVVVTELQKSFRGLYVFFDIRLIRNRKRHSRQRSQSAPDVTFEIILWFSEDGGSMFLENIGSCYQTTQCYNWIISVLSLPSCISQISYVSFVKCVSYQIEFMFIFVQWLRSALSKEPNRVTVSPLIWGRKQIQFPKRCIL
jgi:hypothetical protein